MASMTLEFPLKFELPDMTEAVHQRAAALIVRAATEIQAMAKGFAPVDTGALQQSISVVLADGGDFEANAAAAAGLNPLAQLADAPAVASDLEAYVVVPVHYAAFVEWGVVHAPAQPFMTPAVEAVRPSLEAIWAAMRL